MLEWVTMALYSLLLACVLALGSPYWLWRMTRGGPGWMASLAARLGRVPRELRVAVAGRQVVWVHAVSVGEVLAAARLVADLEHALGDGWRIVVSTTTATGQALARQRFASEKEDAKSAGRVFYYPLDFAWAVRTYLRALQPKMLVLMESELWPRMLVECARAAVPVAVVNARVSDRSFARGMRVRSIWRRLLRRVNLFLTQSEEDAKRLVALGTDTGAVQAAGNLKYDAVEPKASRVAARIREITAGRAVVVAGSTVGGDQASVSEEKIVAEAWRQVVAKEPASLLVLAPRHPERFEEAAKHLQGFRFVRASAMEEASDGVGPDAVLLNTIGDLAAVYGIADVALVGGSLVARGGHNPLEAARFGVPVVMGPSYENFRDIVAKMQAADGIRIVKDGAELQAAIVELLSDRHAAKAMGERGRQVFEQQQGATARTVEALVGLMRSGAGMRADEIQEAAQ